jgi:hypothetical protein
MALACSGGRTGSYHAHGGAGGAIGSGSIADAGAGGATDGGAPCTGGATGGKISAGGSGGAGGAISICYCELTPVEEFWSGQLVVERTIDDVQFRGVVGTHEPDTLDRLLSWCQTAPCPDTTSRVIRTSSTGGAAGS